MGLVVCPEIVPSSIRNQVTNRPSLWASNSPGRERETAIPDMRSCLYLVIQNFCIKYIKLLQYVPCCKSTFCLSTFFSSYYHVWCLDVFLNSERSEGSISITMVCTFFFSVYKQDFENFLRSPNSSSKCYPVCALSRPLIIFLVILMCKKTSTER